MDYLQEYRIDYLYHMTAIENLTSILKNGLLSHEEAHKQKLVHTDISDPHVQDLRFNLKDPFYGKALHSYVPLYFSPRNPMLYRRRELQDDIIILGIDPKLLLEPDVCFTDGNAAARDTYFYRGVEMLGQLPWDIIHAESWSNFENGKRIKCAEVLVPAKISIEKILFIFCRSSKHRENIIKIKEGTHIQGMIKPDLFF